LTLDETSVTKETEPMRHQPRRIIHLDNDDQTARQVARVFGGAFHVIQVQNPRRVIGLMEIEQSIVAVITEQVLRSGDGVELLASVRTFRPHVRRVMLTGYAERAAVTLGLQGGAIQSLLRKPVTDADLLAGVCPELAERAATLHRRASA
jgi:ActR/RegA family two-component response regulator